MAFALTHQADAIFHYLHYNTGLIIAHLKPQRVDTANNI